LPQIRRPTAAHPSENPSSTAAAAVKTHSYPAAVDVRR
jgi:hypothetical protein